MLSPTVLLIDNSDSTPEVIAPLFTDGICFNSCKTYQAFEHFQECPPNILLINTDDLGANKSDFISDCRSAANEDTIIICYSEDADQEVRAKSFQLGVDDFLHSPLTTEEVEAKVNKYSALIKHQHTLAENHKQATQTALNAMMESSQYGGVLRFFNNMYLATNTAQIRDCFFALMNDFGLKSSIQFRIADPETHDSASTTPNPIEEQLFTKMHSDGRLIAFSKRLLVNGTYASFLIKNMPTHDEMAIGRFQDILAVVIEGLDSKLTDLQRLALLRQTTEEVAASSTRLSGVMEQHEQFVVNAMNHVISEINASFDVLDLNEKQEAFFTELTEQVLQSVEDSFIRIGNEQDVLNCLWLSLKTVLRQDIRT